MENKNLQTFGYILVGLGIIGLVASMFFTRQYFQENGGSLPAISFVILLVGCAFSFPSLLEESKGEVSTMRIVVFAVTLVFCMIYIKLAWNISAIESMRIDEKWIYILGLAFGSKAAQKFAEENEEKDTKPEEGKGKTK